LPLFRVRRVFFFAYRAAKASASGFGLSDAVLMFCFSATRAFSFFAFLGTASNLTLQLFNRECYALPVQIIEYSYANANWGDQLTSITTYAVDSTGVAVPKRSVI
jgi:hypothetical protein